LEFTQEKAADGSVMALRGAFTFKDHHSFRALLDALRGGGQHHVLDLSALEFVDSAALGMLLIADDEARAAGWTLTLRRPSVPVARLMEVAAMDSIFTIER
jgi:HptB-dependent secretion and biofilm anti anti-sigma factor